MRVITGLKGRRLKSLQGSKIRPTSDRLRETLFNVLAPRITGARFADLCAGTGAVGIEAVSRGASEVVFVESSRRAADLIAENLLHCGIVKGTRVLNRDVLTAIRLLASLDTQFDIVYLDPPYESALYSQVLRQLVRLNLVVPDGVVIVEHRGAMPLAPSYDDLRPYREIAQGESSLTFYSYE